MLDWLLQVASPSQQLFEEPSAEPNVELHCIQHHILELSEPCRVKPTTPGWGSLNGCSQSARPSAATAVEEMQGRLDGWMSPVHLPWQPHPANGYLNRRGKKKKSLEAQMKQLGESPRCHAGPRHGNQQLVRNTTLHSTITTPARS
ncbi:uncharacterized protein LOC144128400 [Amblyomma americanum]